MKVTSSTAAQPNLRLIHDHEELGELLKKLEQALADADLAASHALLDLFWARLAVHIRAEHLHLFPLVMKGLAELDGSGEVALSEAEAIIAELRADHDFFMHELAEAVAVLRELKPTDGERVRERMNAVHEVVLSIVDRLLTHNSLEEERVYLWATMFLSAQEQKELATRIAEVLVNRPPRFSSESWSQP
jgi:iron-sulfur cluster repair protein YtfE (RIC family)